MHKLQRQLTMASSSSSSSSFYSFFISLLSLLSIFISSSSATPTTITLPISLFNPNPNPVQDPTQKFTHFASLSLARAKHLKNFQNPTQKSSVSTPLYPHGYGGYSISLSIGTPPQTTSFIMDTGSNFVWFPCTKRYQCKGCNFQGNNGGVIKTFMPRASSSARVLGCANPKCGWIHQSSNTQSRCNDCRPPFPGNCSQICPPYLILYAAGSTGGLAIVDTLDFPDLKIPKFLIGCSVFSAQQPAGIAGFGRGSTSLPAQLGLRKFSFCLMSHKFDDSGESTDLDLQIGDKIEKISNVTRTNLLKNPKIPGREALSVYYYVSLKKITIGEEKLKIPSKFISPDSMGNGGAVVDSGTTFTFLTHSIFELVQTSFLRQVKNYPRAAEIERVTGLGLCFNISGHSTVDFPAMKFHFKGGAKMELPLANYISVVGPDAVCFTVVTDSSGSGSGSGLSTGPSVILGNFQMQNFYVEFDLKNEKFGFQPQLCKRSGAKI